MKLKKEVTITATQNTFKNIKVAPVVDSLKGNFKEAETYAKQKKNRPRKCNNLF